MASVMCVDTEMDLTHSIGGNIVINNNLEDTIIQCDYNLNNLNWQ